MPREYQSGRYGQLTPWQKTQVQAFAKKQPPELYAQVVIYAANEGYGAFVHNVRRPPINVEQLLAYLREWNEPGTTGLFLYH